MTSNKAAIRLGRDKSCGLGRVALREFVTLLYLRFGFVTCTPFNGFTSLLG